MRFTNEGILTLEVSDTGIGMDDEQIKKLFQPFSTASLDHHRTYGGTGLGLWISKVIVELMGGRISCKSQLGKGSVFTI